MSKTYILDSDILIAFSRGLDDAIAWVRAHRDAGDNLATTWINSCEFLRVAYIRNNQREILEARNLLSSLFIFFPTTGTSELYAQIYARLQNEGKMVNEFDILIAAIAAENDVIFVTCDTGFEKITELKLEKWRVHIKDFFGILPKDGIEEARKHLKKRKEKDGPKSKHPK